MTIEELHEKIRAAFADVPYPGDGNLGVPEGRDDSESIERFFKARSWQSIKPKELWEAALGFMTPHAFRHYLPAYLLAWDKEEAGDAPDAIFYHLAPPHTEEGKLYAEFFDMNVRDLTLAQKRVISQFFDFVHEDTRRFWVDFGGLSERYDSSMLALRRYWSQF